MYLDPSAGMIFSRSEKKGNTVVSCFLYTFLVFVVFGVREWRMCILHLKRLMQFLINVGRIIQYNPKKTFEYMFSFLSRFILYIYSGKLNTDSALKILKSKINSKCEKISVEEGFDPDRNWNSNNDHILYSNIFTLNHMKGWYANIVFFAIWFIEIVTKCLLKIGFEISYTSPAYLHFHSDVYSSSVSSQ